MGDGVAEDDTFPVIAQRAVEGQVRIKRNPVDFGQHHGGAPGGDADFDAAVLQTGQSLQHFWGDFLRLHIDQRAVNIKENDFRLRHGVPLL